PRHTAPRRAALAEVLRMAHARHRRRHVSALERLPAYAPVVHHDELGPLAETSLEKVHGGRSGADAALALVVGRDDQRKRERGVRHGTASAITPRCAKATFKLAPGRRVGPADRP